MGNTLETEIKELDTMKAYKYLGVEESHSIEHKMEKGRFKKYIRTLAKQVLESTLDSSVTFLTKPF
jgi:hypothetical protein